MIKISATIDDKGARAFTVDLGELVVDRTALNQSLAERLAEELKDHWIQKDLKPNKLGSSNREHIWAAAAKAVTAIDVTESGATVTTGQAGEKIRIHIFGGTIVPKFANSLTIPIVREAHGYRAAAYEAKTGNELFTIGDKPLLFEKVEEGGSESESRYGRRRGKPPFNPTTLPGSNRNVLGKSLTIPIVRKQKIRPVYFLADSVEIKRDPEALPAEADLLAALQEELDDFLSDLGSL